MSTQISENPLFTSIFDQIGSLIQYTHLAVFSLDGITVSMIAYRGPMRADLMRAMDFDYSKPGFVNWILNNQSPILIRNMENDPRIPKQTVHELCNYHFSYMKSYIGFPLRKAGIPFGFIDIAYDQSDYYSEKEVRTLENFIETHNDEIIISVLISRLSRQRYELEVLSDIDREIFSLHEIEPVLSLVADKAHQLISSKQINYYLSESTLDFFIKAMGELPQNIHAITDPDPFREIISAVVASGQILRINGAEDDNPYELAKILKTKSLSILAVPIRIATEPMGVMLAFDREFGAFGPEDESVFLNLANRAASAINIAILIQQEKERRNVTEQVVRMQEQQRIARDLHDSVAQLLFRIGLEVKTCSEKLFPEDPEKENLGNIQRLITQCDEELRNAIFALRAQEGNLNSGSLSYLNDLASAFQVESGIETTLVISPQTGKIPYSIADAITRVVKEALANVLKHSRASGVVVSIHREKEMIILTVEDNGSGLNNKHVGAEGEKGIHFGMDMMSRLTAQCGGTIQINTNDDNGTTLKASFSLRQKD
jgi:two-component system, NarL family, nitrate/nitrite sensor histidine kinase NarX